MNYLQKELANGETAIYRQIYDKQGDTVLIWTGLTYKNKERARKVAWALDMVSSVWAYNGYDIDNRYIQEHLEKLGRGGEKLIRAEFEWLENNAITEYGGEDSEGVWYNSIYYSPKGSAKSDAIFSEMLGFTAKC